MLSEEVHIESSSKDIKDSFKGALNSYQEVDSTSVSQSSGPSVANASASGYDGLRGGIDDGGDNVGEDIKEREQSQYLLSQFTRENDFMHCT